MEEDITADPKREIGPRTRLKSGSNSEGNNHICLKDKSKISEMEVGERGDSAIQGDHKERD